MFEQRRKKSEQNLFHLNVRESRVTTSLQKIMQTPATLSYVTKHHIVCCVSRSDTAVDERCGGGQRRQRKVWRWVLGGVGACGSSVREHEERRVHHTIWWRSRCKMFGCWTRGLGNKGANIGTAVASEDHPRGTVEKVKKNITR